MYNKDLIIQYQYVIFEICEIGILHLNPTLYAYVNLSSKNIHITNTGLHCYNN